MFAQDYKTQGQSFGKWERIVRHGGNSEESFQLYSSNMTSGVMLLLRKLRLVVKHYEQITGAHHYRLKKQLSQIYELGSSRCFTVFI